MCVFPAPLLREQVMPHFSGYRALSPASFPLSLPFSRSWKAGVKNGRGNRRCWDGGGVAKWQWCVEIRGNWILSTALPPFSFHHLSESPPHHRSNGGANTFPTTIQGCVSQCWLNIYPIFTHGLSCAALYQLLP